MRNGVQRAGNGARNYANEGYNSVRNGAQRADNGARNYAQQGYQAWRDGVNEIGDDIANTAREVIGFYPANSIDEDIIIYDHNDDETRSKPIATLFGLRQQNEKETDEPYIAIGDYIAPVSSGVKDYIGLFAVSSGFGLEDMVEKYKKENDDYSSIMAKALADRLAEALAEAVHEDVRREHWAYEKDQPLSNEDLFKIK
ncbi:hypothetical protein ACTFIY_012016 [Dictyostelium cf. discoideum]